MNGLHGSVFRAFTLVTSDVFKGRRERHLPRPPQFMGPLRCFTRRFSSVLVKHLLSTHKIYSEADRTTVDLG